MLALYVSKPTDPLNIVTNICTHLETKISLTIDVFMQTCLQSYHHFVVFVISTEAPASLKFKIHAFPPNMYPF